MLNFISNLPRHVRSGGFSAINAAAFGTLSKHFEGQYVGPIDPAVVLRQKVVSKLRRLAGARGNFFFFSHERLETIAREVAHRSARDADLDFFHGFTPWILTRPGRPYVAWSDATFHDYIEIYHPLDQFRHEDIRRIEDLEAEWLNKAERVLFTSRWAADRGITQYRLNPSRVDTVGIFGEMEMPVTDTYAGGRELAFIATDFERKGGRVVLDAFRRVRASHPNAALIVVGDKPRDLSAADGLSFAGFLRKEDPDELRRYRDILSRARAVVNATISDVSPLLPVEAGYFGCPAISSRRYAIPELIDDKRTGLLIDDPSNANEMAAAMTTMLDENDLYLAMRRAVWKKTREEHSRQRFEDRLSSEVINVLTGTRTQSITTAP
jgi:glycosyltransferase involved in cell wall biosynthesis